MWEADLHCEKRYCTVCGNELTDDEIDICEYCEAEYYDVSDNAELRQYAY